MVNPKPFYTPKPGDTIRAEGVPESINCAHCRLRIEVGEKVLSYIELNEQQTANVIKMQVHENCAVAFFGSGIH